MTIGNSIYYAAFALLYILLIYLFAVRKAGMPALPWLVSAVVQAVSIYFYDKVYDIVRTMPFLSDTSEKICTYAAIAVLAIINIIVIVLLNMLVKGDGGILADEESGALPGSGFNVVGMPAAGQSLAGMQTAASPLGGLGAPQGAVSGQSGGLVQPQGAGQGLFGSMAQPQAVGRGSAFGQPLQGQAAFGAPQLSPNAAMAPQVAPVARPTMTAPMAQPTSLQAAGLSRQTMEIPKITPAMISEAEVQKPVAEPIAPTEQIAHTEQAAPEVQAAGTEVAAAAAQPTVSTTPVVSVERVATAGEAAEQAEAAKDAAGEAAETVNVQSQGDGASAESPSEIRETTEQSTEIAESTEGGAAAEGGSTAPDEKDTSKETEEEEPKTLEIKGLNGSSDDGMGLSAGFGQSAPAGQLGSIAQAMGPQAIQSAGTPAEDVPTLIMPPKYSPNAATSVQIEGVIDTHEEKPQDEARTLHDAAVSAKGSDHAAASPAASMQGMSGMSGMSGMTGQMSGMPSQMPGMPGQMPGMPGQMPGMAGQMSGMPGQMPGMPGQMPGMPGQMPGMSGQMSGMSGLGGMPGQISGVSTMGGISGQIPGAMGMSGMPSQMTGTPGMSGMPGEIPGVGGMSAMSGMPGQLSGMGGLPGQMSGMSGMSGMPNDMPGMSGMSASSPMGGMSGMPGPMAGIPGIPGMSAFGAMPGEMSGGMASHTPDMPGGFGSLPSGIGQMPGQAGGAGQPPFMPSQSMEQPSAFGAPSMSGGFGIPSSQDAASQFLMTGSMGFGMPSTDASQSIFASGTPGTPGGGFGSSSLGSRSDIGSVNLMPGANKPSTFKREEAEERAMRKTGQDAGSAPMFDIPLQGNLGKNTQVSQKEAQDEMRLFDNIEKMIENGQKDNAMKYLKMIAYFGKNQSAMDKAKKMMNDIQGK